MEHQEPEDDERMEFVWIEDVRAAFETLLEVVTRKRGTETVSTVYWVMEDVLAILAGEWTAGDAAAEEDDDDYLQ